MISVRCRDDSDKYLTDLGEKGNLVRRKRNGLARKEVYVGVYAMNFAADSGLERGVFYADFLLFLRSDHS